MPMNLFEQAKQEKAQQDRPKPADTVSYRRGNETSIEGALHASKDSDRQFNDYLDRLKRTRRIGMTDNEASELMGLPPNTISDRRGSPAGKRLVVDSGQTRKSRAGVANKVWIHIDFATGDRH